MFTVLIIIAGFVCFACMAGGVLMLTKGQGEASVEDRLSNLTRNGGHGTEEVTKKFLNDFTDGPGAFELKVSKYIDVRRWLEQAGLNATPNKIFMMSGAIGLVTGGAWLFVGFMSWLCVPLGLCFGTLPLMWVLFKRKRRLKRFGQQLPEALELISRALRAGHSLPAGFHLVAEQMHDPIGPEFGRCFDEQNLGIALEEALEELTERVPNVDLRFFVTAVVIQRQTGGDLAEILDKISKLIRERFQIWGQIQALTGEGRLSGIVLMALPPALFIVMLRINYDYVMKLFSDPLGHKMLVFAVVMQLIGAFAIRKIVNIKV